MKTKFEIKLRMGSVLFIYEAETFKEAVVAAVKSGADLSRANLSGVNLSWADLSGVNLSGTNLSGTNLYKADLSGADLSGADLSWANLYKADLSGAHLSRADLYKANLPGADLSGANLPGADLSGANLPGADLSGAKLSGANLYEADLSGAKNIPSTVILQTSIVPQNGQFIGWKKCRNDVIVKLMIGKNTKRSNATGRKCRAKYVKVLDVIGADFGVSHHSESTFYRKGAIVRCDKWNEDRWVECGGGIHFFITREEAEAYRY